MSIDKTTIENIAKLARIRVTDDQIPALTESLTDILTMIDKLQSADTEGVAPMANPMDATQRLRADQINETDQREAFQAIAPATENGLYLVPKVIE